MLAVQPGGPTRQRRFISTSVKILFTPQNYLRFHAFLPDESTLWLCFLWHETLGSWDSERVDRVVGDVGDLCGRTGALPVRMPC